MEAENLVMDTASEPSFDSDNSFIDVPSEDVMKDMGLDPTKYGLGEEEVKEAPTEESQGSEETQEAAQTEESAYLEWINSLGAVHNDNPLKVESPDEIKNLLQMGKDYTLKTQSLSEERKAWEAEKSSSEKEINEAINEFNNAQKAYGDKLKELEQWTFTLNQLQKTAPDLFEEVQRAYEDTSKQFSNPILDQQLQAIRSELAETKKSLSSREDKLIIDEFEREKSSMSATEQSMKELGVTVDWNKVKNEWASSGQPLKNVVGALYFEQMTKAQASKAKVEATKTKVAARPAGAASASRPGQKQPVIDSKLDYLQRAQQMLKNLNA